MTMGEAGFEVVAFGPFIPCVDEDKIFFTGHGGEAGGLGGQPLAEE